MFIPSKKIVFLSLLPITIVGVYIYRFGVNIPFWDQWEVVSLLMRKHQGLLTLADLFAQHNEHRPFFPNLIWVTLSGFTHYNVNVELWVNFLIAIGLFLFFIKRAMKVWDRAQIQWPRLLIPLLSLLVFNLGQYESWLQGIQTIMFLGIASILGGLFLLADHARGHHFVFAILLGVVANFSMANGLLYWLIGLGVLLVTVPQESRIVKLTVWLVCGSVCMSLFLRGWTSERLDLDYIFTHIPQYILFILNFLGSPINALSKFAWIFGCIGLGLSALIAIHIIKTKKWKETAPYLGIILFILLSALSIAAGRVDLGMEQARVSRYQTMTVWYWASILTLLPLLKIRNIFNHLIHATIAIALMILMFTGYINGQLGIYQRTQPAYQQALTSQGNISDETLALIYPDPDAARPRLEFLCENKLSVCADLP